MRLAVVGAGAVGSSVAELAADYGHTVTAYADSQSAAVDADGIDVEAAFERKQTDGLVGDDDPAAAVEGPYDVLVEALREAGINVIQAGAERYSEAMTVVLSGHLINTDLSDTVSRIQEATNATVTDLSLSAPEGTEDASSARIRLATEQDAAQGVLDTVREVAGEKDLRVIEPLGPGGDL